MTSLVIETTNLTRFFGSRCPVFRLSLHVPKGAIFGLLGPNGAGKTTTIKMLTGRIRPSSGTVRIFGFDPWKERSKLFTRMGYLPERPILYEDKEALSFLTFMGRLKGYSKQQAEEEARRVLDVVGLGKFETHKIGNMSAGQKQRVGIANAILGDPELLLLDEPTANLDPAGRIYISQLIKELGKEGKTILISSHILPEIQRMTTHVGIMAEGRLLASGPLISLTKDVFDTDYYVLTSHPSELFDILSSDEHLNVELQGHQLIVSVHSSDDLPYLWDRVPRVIHEHQWQLQAFAPVRDPLEKVFLRLVSKDPLISKEVTQLS